MLLRLNSSNVFLKSRVVIHKCCCHSLHVICLCVRGSKSYLIICLVDFEDRLKPLAQQATEGFAEHGNGADGDDS